MIITKKDLIKISSISEVKRISAKLDNREQTKIQMSDGSVRVIGKREGKFFIY